MKPSILFIIFLMHIMSGCNKKDVTITKDYVINPNWDEVENSIFVYKMRIKDSSQALDIKDPSTDELRYGLIKDTSFSYSANVMYNGVDYSDRKVYFNRDNGFSWRNMNERCSDCRRKVLGEFQSGTWYLLSMAKIGTLYYVFLDTSDSLHVFKVYGMTNY